MAPPFFNALYLNLRGSAVDENTYSLLYLSSDFSKFVRVHFFRIRYLPILSAFCANERAVVTAAHCRDKVPFDTRQILERF